MHAFQRILFPAWISIVWIISGCSSPVNPDVDILEIEGISWACNVTTSYAVFGSLSEAEEPLKVVLPASEGDLLYMFRDELQFYYRYHEEDGPTLTVRFDTLDAVTASLNGALNYMELTDSASLEAFKQLSNPEIEQLSSLLISAPSSEDLLPVLKLRQDALQGIGLILETDFESEVLSELFSLSLPDFVVLNSSSKLPEPAESYLFSNLELLWIDGDILSLTKLVDCCENLESLIVADWEPETGEMLPLAGLHKLRSLTVAESGLTSLSIIEFPESLRNLYLIGCDTLSDIHELSDLQSLQRLSLMQCSRVKDLAPLQDLGPLQCLSFPPRITQQQFGELAAKFPQLELIELIGCPEIENLSPLQTLPHLHTLLLQLDIEQLTGLDSLTQLSTIILTDQIYNDNEQWIKDLKASLPETTIVPGSGLCLGSGWLLLLIPFILIFRHAFRKKA